MALSAPLTARYGVREWKPSGIGFALLMVVLAMVFVKKDQDAKTFYESRHRRLRFQFENPRFEDGPVSGIQNGDIGQAGRAQVPFAAAFVDVAKYHQLRSNNLAAFQKVGTAGSTNSAPLRYALALTQGRAAKGQEMRILR